MKYPTAPRKACSQDRAFTLIEMMLYTSVLLFVSSTGFNTMYKFNEQRKLRTAAIELSGYLQVARNVAAAENAACIIALTQEGGWMIKPDPSQGNACRQGTIQLSLDLRELSGSRKLTLRTLPEYGTYPLTFTPEGTIMSGATMLISSTNVTEGSWCVDVQAPLATVRIGWRDEKKNNEKDKICNYAIEQ